MIILLFNLLRCNTSLPFPLKMLIRQSRPLTSFHSVCHIKHIYSLQLIRWKFEIKQISSQMGCQDAWSTIWSVSVLSFKCSFCLLSYIACTFQSWALCYDRFYIFYSFLVLRGRTKTYWRKFCLWSFLFILWYLFR